jgi:hypothetical protein
VSGRTWEYWSHRLAQAGRMPPRVASGKSKSRPAKRAAATGKAARKKMRS